MQSNTATKNIAVNLLVAEYNCDEDNDFMTWEDQGISEYEKVMAEAYRDWYQQWVNARGYDYYGGGEVEPNGEPFVQFWRGCYQTWKHGLPSYLGGFPVDKQVCQPYQTYSWPYFWQTLKGDNFKV